MERKIGEVFEYNGEWYQCIPGNSCNLCDMSQNGTVCTGFVYLNDCTSTGRKDGESVIFKKLEKFGEPFSCNYNRQVGLLKMQEYQLYNLNIVTDVNTRMYISDYKHKRIAIEINENMREETPEEIATRIADEFGKKVEKSLKENMDKIKTGCLKPFDLEAAKAGKPVCTRDGRKARIICFDYNGETGDYPIVALVHYNKGNKCYEIVLKYTSDGLFNKYGDCQHNDDLMMLPEKKEGWINVYKERCYETKEEAIRHIAPGTHYIDTIRVEWEDKE